MAMIRSQYAGLVKKITVQAQGAEQITSIMGETVTLLQRVGAG